MVSISALYLNFLIKLFILLSHTYSTGLDAEYTVIYDCNIVSQTCLLLSSICSFCIISDYTVLINLLKYDFSVNAWTSMSFVQHT